MSTHDGKQNTLLLNVAAAATILVSSSVLLASSFPVPVPDCWRLNCINSDIDTILLCRNCCTSNCADNLLQECHCWCDHRIFP